MSISENIASIRLRIEAAAAKTGRTGADITLVGASKMNDAAACREAIAAGIDALGENRVQEMTAKLAEDAKARSAEFVTIFYGEDVNEEDAHKACDAFTRKCPDAEVNLICGGQPVYYYIISIE